MSTDHEKEPLVSKSAEGMLKLTEAGREAIDTWVTDIDSNVYAFTPEADGLMVAGTFARLSRNSNGVKEILINEFFDKENKDSELLHRVVTEFGDDSVMQLYMMQLVFEGPSNLAIKLAIENGRLAGYLEQSSRYLRFDKKNEEGRYAYYTPEEFDPETAVEYEEAMDGIFDIYSDLYQKMYAFIEAKSDEPQETRNFAWRNAVHAQACDTVRALLPAATKATVGVVGSAQAINNMILSMEGHGLPEVNKLGRQALAAARGVAPVFFERTDMPDRGGLISAQKSNSRINSRALANEFMPDTDAEAKTGPRVEVVSVNGTEDELVAKILVDSSDKSYEYVRAVVETLTDEQKQQVIETYVDERYNRRVKPGRAFEIIDYVIEGQTDFGAFRDIQRTRLVDAFKWQSLQNKLGHVRPAAIDEAGLTEEYEKAFAISAKAYKMLAERGYNEQAQYATLFGHVMRFSMKVNARSLLHTTELRTTPQGHPSYRKFYQDLHEQIAAIHPNVAKAMKFVGKGEDEALARLGAERHFEAKQLAAEQ